MMTPTFNANTAGRNCNFANHPNFHTKLPLMSRNINVISNKKIIARDVRNFFNIATYIYNSFIN